MANTNSNKAAGRKASQGTMASLSRALVFAVVAGWAAATIALLKWGQRFDAQPLLDAAEALCHADNAALEGAHRVGEDRPEVFLDTYSLAARNLFRAYIPGDRLSKAALVIERARDAAGADLPNTFEVSSSATVGSRTRSVKAVVRKNAPSPVFDCAYFLDNRAWWASDKIEVCGIAHANWDFIFRGSPTINGDLQAVGLIASASGSGQGPEPIDPFSPAAGLQGDAGRRPQARLRPGVPKIFPPNLRSYWSYYGLRAREAFKERQRSGVPADKAPALASGGVSVEATLGEEDRPQGAFLDGTPENPIRLNGLAVVNGDLALRGAMTGRGVVYVLGNIYVAGDLYYLDGPDFSRPPSMMPPAERDAWVRRSAGKDLAVFVSRESVLVGRTNSIAWREGVCQTEPWGLEHVGGEIGLGADGVPDTADDGVSFDSDGDGKPDSAWFDADLDGRRDEYFDYKKDIELSDERIDRMKGYPALAGGVPQDYADVASDSVAKLEGVFYAARALGVKTSAPLEIHGAIASRCEAIVFEQGMKIVYDPRVHSRVHSPMPGGEAPLPDDLLLPIGERARILSRVETGTDGQPATK